MVTAVLVTELKWEAAIKAVGFPKHFEYCDANLVNVKATERCCPRCHCSSMFRSEMAALQAYGCLELTVEQTEALIRALSRTIGGDRYLSLTEGGAASDNAVPPLGPDTGTAVPHENSPE